MSCDDGGGFLLALVSGFFGGFAACYFLAVPTFEEKVKPRQPSHLLPGRDAESGMGPTASLLPEKGQLRSVFDRGQEGATRASEIPPDVKPEAHFGIRDEPSEMAPRNDAFAAEFGCKVPPDPDPTKFTRFGAKTYGHAGSDSNPVERSNPRENGSQSPLAAP